VQATNSHDASEDGAGDDEQRDDEQGVDPGFLSAVVIARHDRNTRYIAGQPRSVGRYRTCYIRWAPDTLASTPP